ncbi:MAG: hypothetical protein ACREJC_04820, partial [Tepidisphaeraceae bacterium]
MLESLETRRMLCYWHEGLPKPFEPAQETGLEVPEGLQTVGPEAASIVWTNRGITSGTDNDLFNDVFGANAGLARSVMDAAIFSWQRVVSSFNYGSGTDVMSLTIKMGGAGLGASAATPTAVNGKPKIGSITMGSGNDGFGSGWYLDPTPLD